MRLVTLAAVATLIGLAACSTKNPAAPSQPASASWRRSLKSPMSNRTSTTAFKSRPQKTDTLGFAYGYQQGIA